MKTLSHIHSFIYVGLLVFLFSCSSSVPSPGVYEVDKEALLKSIQDAVKGDPDAKDAPLAGIGETLVSGMISNSDVFLVVTEDSVFQFNPFFTFSDSNPYHAVPYTKTDQGISFTSEGGVSVTLKKQGDGYALTGTDADVLYSKVSDVDREKELREKADKTIKTQKEYARKIAILNNVLDVKLLEKGFYEYGYNDYLTFRVSIKNQSNEDIQAFNGIFQFFDLLDNELYSVRWMDDDGLGALQEEEKALQVDYNQFDDGLSSLKDKDLSKIRMTWSTTQVLYANGEKIDIGEDE